MWAIVSIVEKIKNSSRFSEIGLMNNKKEREESSLLFLYVSLNPSP